jgi:hypothetical protein
VNLMMASGVKQSKIRQVVVLVIAISMMQVNFLFDLDHLPTA